jgi:hypothetical protein
VLAAFAETGPKYKVSALKALTSVIGKLPAHIQSCKLDILLALALDTKAGLSYPDQVDILDSVNLLPASHRLSPASASAAWTVWLDAMKKLGGHALSGMLFTLARCAARSPVGAPGQPLP